MKRRFRNLYEAKEFKKAVTKFADRLYKEMTLNEMARPIRQIDLANYGFTPEEALKYNKKLNRIFSPSPLKTFEKFVKEIIRIEWRWLSGADEEYLDEVGWNIYWDKAVAEALNNHPEISEKIDEEDETGELWDKLFEIDGIIDQIKDSGDISVRLSKHPGHDWSLYGNRDNEGW